MRCSVCASLPPPFGLRRRDCSVSGRIPPCKWLAVPLRYCLTFCDGGLNTGKCVSPNVAVFGETVPIWEGLGARTAGWRRAENVVDVATLQRGKLGCADSLTPGKRGLVGHGYAEQDAQTKAQKARDEYKDALRQFH